MTRTARMLVATTAVLVASTTFALSAQDTPDALMSCIANGTKVGHTYLQHADAATLKQAVRLFETRAPDVEYPEGTIVRVIPQEAMIKRTRAAFPSTNGWEYFALAVTPQGTTVRSRGDDASNRIGTCQSCHSGAAKSDYLCGAGSGCPPVPLTEVQIAQLQAADPRCK